MPISAYNKTFRSLLWSASISVLLLSAGSARAENPVVPYNATHPVPFPVVTTQNTPPLIMDKPRDPVYIPTLKGTVTRRPAINFTGGKTWKEDGLVIKMSKVEDGKITIPVGGFVFKFDAISGILPMTGNMEFVFGEDNLYYYVDYPGAVIVKKENVTLRRGEKVLVGDNIYQYISATGHGRFRNPTIDIRNKLGANWDFYGMSPFVFSIGASEGDPGKDFHYGYYPGSKPGGEKEMAIHDFNQLFATRSDISMREIKLDTIYSTDVQEWNMCKAPLAFKGRAGKGKKITVRDFTVEVIDTARKGKLYSVKVRITKAGKTVAEKTLVWDSAKDKDFYLSPYNVKWQQKVLLKHKDITVQLLGSVFILEDGVDEGGEANLVVYQNCFAVKDGKTTQWDRRFLVDQILCPQGHGYGTMFYNKEEIVLTKKNNVYLGPASYVSLVIDDVKGDTAKFHLESKAGGKSISFTKKGNVDLLFGRGRGANDIVHDLYHSLQEQMYRQMERIQGEAGAK